MTTISTVEIALPPQGTYTWTYTLLSLSVLAGDLAAYGSLEVEIVSDRLVLKGINPQDFCIALQSHYNEIIGIARNRSSIAVYPKAHQNDRKNVGGKIGVTSKDASYLEIFLKIMVDSISDLKKNCPLYLRSLAAMRTDPKTGSVILGDDKQSPLLPAIQPFKLEKYEYAKSADSFKVKMDIRMTEHYAALPVSGWLLSYMGFYGKLVFAMPPESLLASTLLNPIGAGGLGRIMINMIKGRLRNVLFGPNGYYASVAKAAKYGTSPVEALILLELTEISEYLKQGLLLPMRILTVKYDGRRFTVGDDILIDPRGYMDFLQKIAGMKSPETIIRPVSDLAKCCLIGYSGKYSERCRARYGDSSTAVRLVKILYLAISRGMSPERAVYMLARLSPETGDAPLRRPSVINALLYALR